MQETLVSQLHQTLPDVLEDQLVQLAYLYGSAVAGRTTPFSDVDIALLTTEPLTPLARLRLIQHVQTRLYDACGLDNVDVRIINDAPLVLQGRIVTDGRLVYTYDEQARIDFETTTRMYYFDYLPIHQQLQTAFFDTLRTRGLYGRSR